MNTFARRVLALILGITLVSAATNSRAAVRVPIAVTMPLSRIVFQRDLTNQAIVPISGTCPKTARLIEARLVPREAGQGVPTEWTPLPRPVKGAFHGTLTATGGWYNLELRVRNATKIMLEAVVERVGVGEVFVVVGHSVAAGQKENMPAATDDRVNTVPLDKQSTGWDNYWRTGNPDSLPNPGFAHYGEGVIPAPFGSGNYFWSAFGEQVARKENVPVLIYNAAFGGTSLEHWSKSAQSVPFEHSFVKAAIRMPYINLRNTLVKYVPLTGLRAVLADQGQNDWPEKNEDLVFGYYQAWVAQARKDLGFPELAVVVNRQTPFLRDAQIRRMQERMIRQPHCFAGPDYDTLAKADRPDDIHLGLAGQAHAARLWAEALDAAFFRTAQPWVPALK